MEEKIKRVIETLNDFGYGVGDKIADGNKIMINNFDGILGGYGLRGWQWEHIRKVFINEGLDYYIFDEMVIPGSLVLVIITLEESLNY